MKHRISDQCDGIVVHSMGCGICNRVPALAAFAAIAQRLHCPLYCYWTSDDHCPGYPEDCFDRWSLYWQPVDEDQYVGLIRSLRYPAIFPYIHTSAPVRHFAGWSGFDEQGIWLQVAKFIRLLRPEESIVKQLQSLDVGRENRVGIHVRRTDLYGGGKMNNSQRDEVLIRKLDSLAPDAEAGDWLVAADNPQSLQMLQERYGSRVMHTGASWTVKGIRMTSISDAALDLFALAGCARIIGTAGSTFGTVASILGGSKLEMI